MARPLTSTPMVCQCPDAPPRRVDGRCLLCGRRFRALAPSARPVLRKHHIDGMRRAILAGAPMGDAETCRVRGARIELTADELAAVVEAMLSGAAAVRDRDRLEPELAAVCDELRAVRAALGAAAGALGIEPPRGIDDPFPGDDEAEPLLKAARAPAPRAPSRPPIRAA